MSLGGKVAIVTGASRGIGRAIARDLGAAGARVGVNYARGADGAAETVETIRRPGGDALAVQADVSDFEQVRAMVARVKETFGGIDILVNNAGVLRDNPVTFMQADEWARVLDVNLGGAFHCIKAAGRELARRHGRVVNISSDAGLMGDSMRANYAASKAGMIGLTKTVAREFAASGVTVNAVAPGIIATDMIAGLAETRLAKQLALVPQGRAGTPEEVSAVVMFLVSDAAAYITGQVLRVDGGLNMNC